MANVTTGHDSGLPDPPYESPEEIALREEREDREWKEYWNKVVDEKWAEIGRKKKLMGQTSLGPTGSAKGVPTLRGRQLKRHREWLKSGPFSFFMRW